MGIIIVWIPAFAGMTIYYNKFVDILEDLNYERSRHGYGLYRQTGILALIQVFGDPVVQLFST